jgi:hypothetical protein
MSKIFLYSLKSSYNEYKNYKDFFSEKIFLYPSLILSTQHSYCDHRNFDSVNRPLQSVRH